MAVRLQAARFKLSQDKPYFSPGLWALLFNKSDQVETMGVDRFYRLYYNEQWTEKLPTKELEGLLLHELYHLLRDHADRAEILGADPTVWNVATDLAINDELTREGVALPKDGCFPTKYNLPVKMTSEEYYRLLLKSARKPPPSGSGAQPSNGRCGSCATGKAEPWELPDPVGPNDQGLNKMERRLLQREVADQMSKYAGRLPGNWETWVADQLAAPKVNWRHHLAGLVRGALYQTAGIVNYSYSRISRRQAASSSVIFPSMVRPIPNVVVVLDTSGSMGPSEYRQALGEVNGVLKSVGLVQGVEVLTVDTEVHTSQRVHDARRVKLEGGGGTDMGQGLAVIATRRKRPDLVVVLTDGYTPWPEVAPPLRVVAGIIGHCDQPTPRWLRVVHIEKN